MTWLCAAERGKAAFAAGEHEDELVVAHFGKLRLQPGVVGLLGFGADDINATMRLIRRGARVVQRLKGDLLVVHVKTRGYKPLELEVLNELEGLTREFGAGWAVLDGTDTASSLIDYLHGQHATQVIVGESHRSRWREIVAGSVVLEILRRSTGIDVYIIADD